ncbi:MAG TPA: hypothetical protein DCY27_00315 [Desulfobacterales bacterium]|nr:hypothetical protein [Desulfobacterales bacterium]
MPSLKSIKVLFFSRVPKIGGGETSLLAIIEGLDKTREIPVFAAIEDGPLAQEVKKLGVKVKYCGPVPPGLLSIRPKTILKKILYTLGAGPALWRLFCILKNEKIDIAHANEALEAAFLYLPCLAAGVPLIWTVRNLFTMRPLYKALYGWSTAVMAVSQAAAVPLTSLEQKRAFGGHEPKVRVIYEGISVPPPVNPPFGGKPYTAAIIGRLSPDKGQELFLKAAALVSQKTDQVKYLIVGDTHLGDPDYAGFLQRMAQDLGLKENLRFTGFASDIWELLSQVDLVVMACPIEAFGRVTIEAMAAGRPVIGIRAGGTAEIILSDVTGKLIANDPEELARAMLELLDDPQKAADMGLAGRKRVEESFTIQNMVSRITEMYREILKT